MSKHSRPGGSKVTSQRQSGRFGRTGVIQHGTKYGPAAVLLVLAAHSSYGRPLWRDEVATWLFAGLSLRDLTAATSQVDSVLGPYYFVIHMLTSSSDSPFALRALSISAGTITVMVVGHMAYRWWGPVGALMSGLTLALNPLFIEVSATARPYALATMLVAWAFFFVDRALGPGRRVVPWMGFSICVYLLGLTHLLAILIIGATIVLLAGREKEKRFAWVVAVGIAGLALVPFVLQAFNQRGQVSWIPAPTMRSAIGSLASLLVYERDGYLGIWQATALLLLGLTGVAALVLVIGFSKTSSDDVRRQVNRLVFAGTAFMLPWLLLLVESLISSPYLRTMYLTPSLIGVSLFLGGSLSQFVVTLRGTKRMPIALTDVSLATKKRLAAGAGIVFLVANLALPLPTTFKAISAPWWIDDFRGLSSTLEATTSLGDVVAFVQTPSESGVRAGIARTLHDENFASSSREQTISGTKAGVELRKVINTDPFSTERILDAGPNLTIALVYTRGAITTDVLEELQMLGIECDDTNAAAGTLPFGILRYDQASCRST